MNPFHHSKVPNDGHTPWIIDGEFCGFNSSKAGMVFDCSRFDSSVAQLLLASTPLLHSSRNWRVWARSCIMSHTGHAHCIYCNWEHSVDKGWKGMCGCWWRPKELMRNLVDPWFMAWKHRLIMLSVKPDPLPIVSRLWYHMIPYQISARAECVHVPHSLFSWKPETVQFVLPIDSQMWNLIAPACLVEQPTLH